MQIATAQWEKCRGREIEIETKWAVVKCYRPSFVALRLHKTKGTTRSSNSSSTAHGFLSHEGKKLSNSQGFYFHRSANSPFSFQVPELPPNFCEGACDHESPLLAPQLTVDGQRE